MVLMYEWDFFSPAWDVAEFLPLVILQMSLGYWRVHAKILPPFYPNEYLFNHHEDKGQEKWEIFAWAVRDAMAISGPL